ncbi:hypothetical protein D9M70_648860 [compost metagenome]
MVPRLPASRSAFFSTDLRMNSHRTVTRLSLRRSSWQYIQNERVISTSFSSTGVSRGSCAAMKQGRIASDWPCSAAWYCATTLVLRSTTLLAGSRSSR